MQNTAIPKRSFRIEEFARRHSISRSKVYEAIKQKRLNARKIDGITIITDEDEAHWLASLPQTKTGADAAA
jgi:hypothetical protein